MSDPAIQLDQVGKMYKVFPSRRAALFDAVGIPARRTRYREFWAVRGIDLELGKGQRLGLIGRNGAGKSTLLKLITQNVAPTEGAVTVDGSVQALLEIGGGLHPEFTGRENIHAALALLGLDDDEIRDAEGEIAEFTELGRFLDQPFKTFSQGMQGRLAFAIATTVEPEILIVDEVLGAGDAFFVARSAARMRQLLEGGAAVLLVSHSMEQVARFCDETVWLDRGRIVMRGPTLDVVKAYEKFIREIEGKRLEAKNRKLRLGTFDSFERESYSDFLSIRLRSDEPFDLRLVRLLRDAAVEDEVAVGSPQDLDDTQSAYVVAGDGWGPAAQEEGAFHRRVEGAIGGTLLFNLWFFYPDAEYGVELVYRATAPIAMEVEHAGAQADVHMFPPAGEWTSRSTRTGRLADTDALSRWMGTEGPRIESVRLLGGDERDRTVFETQTALSVVVAIAAGEPSTYSLIPAILVFREGGLVVTRHVGERLSLELGPESTAEVRLDYGPLLLGDGTYHVSVGLYRRLDVNDVQTSEYYDYFDRSFEFQVVGSPPLHSELIRHPGEWRVTQMSREATANEELTRLTQDAQG